MDSKGKLGQACHAYWSRGLTPIHGEGGCAVRNVSKFRHLAASYGSKVKLGHV